MLPQAQSLTYNTSILQNDTSGPLATNEKKHDFVTSLIKDRMRECGLGRQDFAKLMNVQASIVTRWLSGSHNFTLETLFDIERRLSFQIFPYTKGNGSCSVHFHLKIESTTTDLSNPSELFQVFERLPYLNHLTPNIDSYSNDDNYEFPERLKELILHSK